MLETGRPPQVLHRRLRLRHLFVVIAAASVLFAVLAALVRSSDPKIQLSAFAQSVVLVAMVVGCVGFVFHRRQRVELQAGALIERYGRVAGTVLNWLIVVSLAGWLIATPFLEWYKSKPGELVNYLPSPILLFMLVNYAIVRLWWKVDPMGLEAWENGLIFGGWQYVPWSEISRYTWSGGKRRQLNLFLKKRIVIPIKADASFADRLDRVLAAHVGVEDAEAGSPAANAPAGAR